MKMTMRAMTIEELQKIYTKPAVRPEGSGYYVRKIRDTETKYYPKIQLHVPCMGLPLENGEPIDLLRGFSMPRLREAMDLYSSYEIRFLFCNNFYVHPEPAIRKEICHITLCDPEDSQYILMTVVSSRSVKYGNEWQGNYCHYSNHRLCDSISYSIVPIGFRNTPEGVEQTPEDMERVKRAVIKIANEYLGIGSEESFTTSEAQAVEEASVEPSPKFVIPGLTSGSEHFDSWVYYNDIGAEDCWVIDQCGRLLSPTIVEDYKDKFMEESIEIAEHRIWENVPDTALVLSWSKPSISENHEFTVDREPDRVTPSQLERVAILEHNIEEEYGGKISPYDQKKSPDIRGGWNLWQHGPLK